MPMPPAIAGDYLTEHSDEVLYRSALIPVVALVLVGPQLGLGRAALDFVIGKAPNKTIAYTNYTSQKESTAFQLQIAEAARLIDTAHCTPTGLPPTSTTQPHAVSIPTT